jgi:fumarate hydratase class II
MSTNYRQETDSIGAVQVPADAYYGAQTQRALENFTISGRKMPLEIIYAIAAIKKAAALANAELKEIPPEFSGPIATAADEIIAGKMDDQFEVDVFQTGSGTSTHMNVNEVISTRANEILTGQKNTKNPVHPNDHVNRGQSTNDVMPSAIHIAASLQVKGMLLPAIKKLQTALDEKARQFADIKKIGRTHLQDAVVMTLGQEFSGYAAQMKMAQQRLSGPAGRLYILALGGTAVGTGLNAHPQMAEKAIAIISNETGIGFVKTPNHFQAQAAIDTIVETGGVLKTTAIAIAKTANDIRWLASGPRCGLGELILPELIPGSSIMPGKVNPAACEAAIQACAHIAGNDMVLSLAGQGGYFELNLMLPLAGFKLIESINILAKTADLLSEKCVSGICANKKQCRDNITKSLAVVTGLVPYTGYDRAAEIARRAHETGKTIEQIAAEENILPADELKKALYGAT